MNRIILTIAILLTGCAEETDPVGGYLQEDHGSTSSGGELDSNSGESTTDDASDGSDSWGDGGGESGGESPECTIEGIGDEAVCLCDGEPADRERCGGCATGTAPDEWCVPSCASVSGLCLCDDVESDPALCGPCVIDGNQCLCDGAPSPVEWCG